MVMCMTHNERQSLIRQPFRCELPGGCCEVANHRNTVVKGRSWGGPKNMAGIGSGLDRFDESYLRYGVADDPRQGES